MAWGTINTDRKCALAPLVGGWSSVHSYHHPQRIGVLHPYCEFFPQINNTCYLLFWALVDLLNYPYAVTCKERVWRVSGWKTALAVGEAGLGIDYVLNFETLCEHSMRCSGRVRITVCWLWPDWQFRTREIENDTCHLLTHCLRLAGDWDIRLSLIH